MSGATPALSARALATAAALDEPTTSQRASILGVPEPIQALAVEVDMERANIEASDKWSAAEKARQRSALDERADAVILAVHAETSQEAHKALGKREGIARATARGTLPEYAAGEARLLAKLAALGALRASVDGAATAADVLLAVEDAELTEDADVIRAVLSAAHARAAAVERETPSDQRLRPGGVEWTSAKMALAARVRQFATAHPSPAEVLRQTKVAREKLQAHEARQLDQWRELFGLGPVAALKAKFPGWRA